MPLNNRFRQLLDSLVEEYDKLNRTVDGLQQENAKLRQQQCHDVCYYSPEKLEQSKYVLPLPKGDTQMIETPRLYEVPIHSATVFAEAAQSPLSLQAASVLMNESPSPPLGKAHMQSSLFTESLSLYASTPTRHLMQNRDKPKDSDYGCIRGSEQLNRKLLSRSVSRIGDLHQYGLSHHEEEFVRSAAAQRLRARFGKLIQDNAWIDASILLGTLKSLGLVKYSEEDLDELIKLLMQLSDGSSTQVGVLASITHGLGMSSKRQSVQSSNGSTGWLRCCKKRVGQMPQTQLKPSRSAGWLGRLRSQTVSVDSDRWTRMDFDDFVQIILSLDVVPRAYQVDPEIAMHMETIREVLLSGESNRLVAELTNVRIDDLASPPPETRFVGSFEPAVYIMILANTIAVGFQTNSEHEHWFGWTCIETVFATFFAIELVVRVLSTGISQYFCGKDFLWNLFDTTVVVFAIVDVTMTFMAAAVQDIVSLSVLRLMRMMRLTRLIRMFHFKLLKELTLMLKGLLGGLRTLLWATLLLVAAMYIIGVFCCWAIGKSHARQLDETYPSKYFRTVLTSMFTAFRCFLGDCSDDSGVSITVRLTERHGVPFMLAYCITTIIVNFGIFNIIIAIYIESTLDSAKKRYRDG